MLKKKNKKNKDRYGNWQEMDRKEIEIFQRRKKKVNIETKI